MFWAGALGNGLTYFSLSIALLISDPDTGIIGLQAPLKPVSLPLLLTFASRL